MALMRKRVAAGPGRNRCSGSIIAAMRIRWSPCFVAMALIVGPAWAVSAADEAVHRLPLESEFVGPGVTVSVLLPAAYATEPEARFRVLYVLPVEPGNERRFGDPLAVIQALGLHDTHRLICIVPEFDTTPWYGDHATDKRVRHDSHMVRAVVPFVEDRFRTLAKSEGRLLLGFSKSGSGAISLLLRHGDVFGIAASWDAPLMLTDRQFGIWKTDGHFGTPDAMASQMPAALLRRHAAAFQDRPRLVITGKNKFGTSSDRRFPYDGPSHTEAFHALADELGVPHVYDADIAAPHSWHEKWVAPLVGMLMKTASSADPGPPPTSDVK
jgi:hypothetical protein